MDWITGARRSLAQRREGSSSPTMDLRFYTVLEGRTATGTVPIFDQPGRDERLTAALLKGCHDNLDQRLHVRLALLKAAIW